MKTKKIIITALFAALTCVATMIVKIPTPTMGYIHPGDAIVLLSGFILGPVYGGLAAGIGSAFSDLFSGYVTYVIPTFLIKAITAILAVNIARGITKVVLSKGEEKKNHLLIPAIITGGIAGEAFMVFGYFVFEIFMLGLATGEGLTASTISSGAIASLEGVPFNIIQGVFGVVVSSIIYPFVYKVYTEE